MMVGYVTIIRNWAFNWSLLPFIGVFVQIPHMINTFEPGILFLWEIGKQYSPRWDAVFC